MNNISIRTGFAAAAAALLLLTGCSATVDAKPADAPAPGNLNSQVPDVETPAPTAEASDDGNTIKVPGVEIDVDNGKISAPGVEVDAKNGTVSAPGVEVSVETGAPTANTCNEPVVISEDDAFIRITGDCPSITVSGSNVNLGFEKAGTLAITGKDTFIRGGQTGTLTIESDENNVGVTVVGDLLVSGNENFVRTQTRTGDLKDSGSGNNIG